MPKAVRDALGAKPGDDIEFVPTDGGLVVGVRHRRDVLEFAGIAARAAARVPATAAELDDLAQQGMTRASVERAERARRGSR